jgi:branched-chain amino acid transport system permease protein
MAEEIILVLFGLSLGGIYALLVLGLVLTYRMSRFLNLAHGAMGMFVTYVYWQMATDWGWNRWLALALALGVIAPVLGVLVGRLLYRSLLGRDDSAKIAGSVLLVLALTEVAGKVWGSSGGKLPRILPNGSIRVGDAYFGWDRVTIIAIAAIAAVGVGGLLARTRVGAEMRAVAENRSVAGLFGVDVTRTETLGWALATSLAALAGILISSLSSLNSFQLTFLVISALAAAAVGRLTSIPGAIAGAVILGVAQSEMSRLPADFVRRFGSLPAAAPFLLLVAALVVLVRLGRDVGGGEVDQTAGQGGQPVLQSGVLRLGSGLRHAAQPRARVIQAALFAAAAAATVGVALLVAGVLNSGWLFLVTTGAIWTIAFASMALLNGLGGQVSLCQASFMGVGALVAAKFQQSCATNPINGRTDCVPLQAGWRVWAAYLLAMVVAGIVGVAVAAGTARVRGVMLAVVTLSFGFFLDQTLFPSRDIAGGEFGFRMQRPAGFAGPTAFWVLCAALAVVSVLEARNLSR